MKEIVYVPRDLEDSIPDFLKNRKMDVLLLSDSIYSGDFETVEKIAHTLKGVAYRYGFNGISKLGEVIEKSAKKREFSKLIKAVGELDDELDDMEIVYI